MKFDISKSVWQERYRPQCVDDMILPDKIKAKIKNYLATGDLPNIGLWSADPGLGKSSLANAIIKETGCRALFINASLEKGIDTLRGKIMNFATSSCFDDKFKICVMDECLDENEEVVLLKDNVETPTKLKDLEKNKIYQCKSLNLETGKIENDTCEVVSDHEDDIYEVELEDGRKILVTSNHPFIVEENDKLISKSIDDGLNSNDYVKVR